VLCPPFIMINPRPNAVQEGNVSLCCARACARTHTRCARTRKRRGVLHISSIDRPISVICHHTYTPAACIVCNRGSILLYSYDKIHMNPTSVFSARLYSRPTTTWVNLSIPYTPGTHSRTHSRHKIIHPPHVSLSHIRTRAYTRKWARKLAAI
jgi:hypothetical protein